jgi:hypothetical protein
MLRLRVVGPGLNSRPGNSEIVAAPSPPGQVRRLRQPVARQELPDDDDLECHSRSPRGRAIPLTVARLYRVIRDDGADGSWTRPAWRDGPAAGAARHLPSCADTTRVGATQESSSCGNGSLSCALRRPSRPAPDPLPAEVGRPVRPRPHGLRLPGHQLRQRLRRRLRPHRRRHSPPRAHRQRPAPSAAPQ